MNYDLGHDHDEQHHDEPLEQLATEQWDRELPPLESLSTLDMLRVLNAEDQRVALAVGRALPAIAQAVDLLAEALRAGGRIFYVGAGTSGRLAALDAAECPPTFGVPIGRFEAVIAGGGETLTQARESAEDDAAAGAAALDERACAPRDVVVGLAASGRTPFVVGALRWARTRGIPTIGITANPNTPVVAVAALAIVIETGSEVIMGSTRLKAGTAQKLVLNMLSTGSMVRIGKTYRNLMVDMRATNTKLQARAQRMVMLALACDAAEATRLLDMAEGSVKAAIVLGGLRCSVPEAEQRLARAHGSLSAALANGTDERTGAAVGSEEIMTTERRESAPDVPVSTTDEVQP